MTSRAYDGDDDLGRMQALVREAWAEHGPHVECTAGDLDWRRYRSASADPSGNVRLWEVAGALVGFAWFYENGDLDLLVHPRRHCADVVPEMIAWAERRPDRRLTAWALEGNAPLVAALERSGLLPVGRHYVHLHGVLESLELDRIALPDGYRLRAVEGPSEAEARAAVHRAAFGSERFTAGVCATLMRSAREYRRELDVVAVAPDGALAAFAIGWLDAATGVGELEPVGTAPAHRRRGLARAVSKETLRRLRDAGARHGLVYAHAGDAASLATYRALGLREVDRNVGFARVAPARIMPSF